MSKAYLDTLQLWMVWIIIGFMFMGLGYALNISTGFYIVDECDKYRDQYHYQTEIVGSLYKWDGSFDCVILMEDGTKVSLNDFDISDYKKPRTFKGVPNE